MKTIIEKIFYCMFLFMKMKNTTKKDFKIIHEAYNCNEINFDKMRDIICTTLI